VKIRAEYRHVVSLWARCAVWLTYLTFAAPVFYIRRMTRMTHPQQKQQQRLIQAVLACVRFRAWA